MNIAVLNDSSVNILGVKVSNTDPERASLAINRWIDNREKAYVCVTNVATVIDCQKDSAYQNVINNAGLRTPDGMPLVWIGKKRGFKDIQRTYGPDLMLKMCDMGQSKGYRHFFYGGTDEILNNLKNQLLQKFPKLKIEGMYAPKILEINEIEREDVIDRINDANPDILWVGIGSPKQDYWMLKHRDRLNVPVMVGVGAAFDFLSGIKKQAPPWMRRIGLEWFFRLCSEPKRLWRRYLVGNTKFIYYLLKNSLKAK